MGRYRAFLEGVWNESVQEKILSSCCPYPQESSWDPSLLRWILLHLCCISFRTTSSSDVLGTKWHITVTVWIYYLKKYRPMIACSGTKHLLGALFLSRVGVTVGRQYSLTWFGTLLLRQSAAADFLPMIKTVQVIHLIKLLWDSLAWMKSYNLIRHFEMAEIWFGFHNSAKCAWDLSLHSVIFCTEDCLLNETSILYVQYWMFYYT